MVLARFHIFLKSPMWRSLLIFEKISVLSKVYSTNRPHRLKTQMCFAKHNCVLPIKTQKCFESKHFVFCHTPDNCFASIRTVMQIIVSNTKDDLRPHRPPPLPLSAPCWRRRHHCHGCRVVAAIAAVAIATATATAAAVSAPPPAPFPQLLLPLFG
jgi:hypothetical protein